MKILLIDTDDIRYEILSEVASLSESSVVKISDLEEAKAYMLNNKDFHAVIAVPKLNGIPTLQLLGIMKKDPVLKDIPFIIIAEEPSQSEIEYYKTLGVVEVFEIPFNPLEVFLVITNHLKDTKGEEEVKAILSQPQEEKSLIKKIIEFIKKLFGLGR